jgi:hypothetical protein
MLRKGIVLFLFASIILVTVLSWLWKSHAKAKLPLPTRGVAAGRSAQGSPSPTATISLAASASPIPTREVQEQAFISAFRTPIAFYGKVVDQHNAAVAEADVKLSANDKPLGGRPTEYILKSDQNGFFGIEGIVGLNLSVQVSKPGFKVIPRASAATTSSGLFEYNVSAASTRPPHSPDKTNPVLFMLHRPGVSETLVKVGERNFRIARNGSPLRIPLASQGGEPHEVVLRCWNKDSERSTGARQYDWRFEISVPQGGLVARSNDFAFEAPPDGYASSDIVDMPGSLPPDQWHGFARRSYFIRFNDCIFARVNVEMRAAGDHFVAWESYLNPKPQSRNLEYSPEQQAGDASHN